MSAPESVPFPDSLCHRCLHLRVIRTRRGSAFLQCRHPELPRYPRQPVLSCPGYESTEPTASR